MSDRIFGGLGLLFAMFYIWQASLVQESFLSDVVGPKTFPFILGAGLALASLAILLKPDTGAHWPRGMQLVELAMAVAVMGFYAWAVPLAGFVLATALASAYLTWRLGTDPITAGLFGAGASVVLYVTFRLGLGLSLAAGPWGF